MPGEQFLVPNLPVRDVPASQAFYRDVLGFRVNWIWDDNFGSVGNGEIALFLYESAEPAPVICSIFLDDVEGFYDRCRERGAEIVSELELKPWGVREFSLRDPDGNIFRIGRGEQPSTELAEFTIEGAR
jgi:catechol 2,3-dioxygenase-like lactoylglutathione lyase family enzyme